MEEFSRRVLAALLVAAAGPGAGMLALLLIGPTLVAASTPDTEGGILENVGSLLVGLLIGGALAVVVAYFVAAAATLVALRATGCLRPHLAWVICLVLSPMWMAVLSKLDTDTAGFLVLSGALPGAVRLGFSYLELPSSLSGDLISPPSEIQ
jgi:hypothetical protein